MKLRLLLQVFVQRLFVEGRISGIIPCMRMKLLLNISAGPVGIRIKCSIKHKMIPIAIIVVRSLSSLVSVTSSSLTLINDNFYRNRVG